jgi:hypothetical protein
MSAQAVIWKIAFGVLVLLLSAVAYVTRPGSPGKESAVQARAPAAVPATAPQMLPAVARGPACTAPSPVPAQSAAQETPARIHIALIERPAGDARPAVVKTQRLGKQAHTAKLRLVRVAHRPAHHARRSSPYAAGQPHYPFNPNDRWRAREG